MFDVTIKHAAKSDYDRPSDVRDIGGAKKK